MELFVSVISEIELLGYNGIGEDDKLKIKFFLSECAIISLDNEVKELSINIKQKFKVKTPDAIIASTAIFFNLPLITADKGFEKNIRFRFNDLSTLNFKIYFSPSLVFFLTVSHFLSQFKC